MRLLLVDNYDSFAFNLVQGFAAQGASVDVARNDALTVEEALGRRPDAIVLSPGPRGPADAGISVPLVRAAAAAGVPLLGVCLGHQAVVAAYGGRVVRGRRPVHGRPSAVRHSGEGLFAGLPDPFEGMRYHSLVAAEPLPRELRAVAWTDDADRVPMAVVHRDLPVIGLQFHPESYLTPEGPRLLGRFLRLARPSLLPHRA